jgi:hypothetical protein
MAVSNLLERFFFTHVCQFKRVHHHHHHRHQYGCFFTMCFFFISLKNYNDTRSHTYLHFSHFFGVVFCMAFKKTFIYKTFTA